jgi:hypothetical protein
MGHAEVYLAAWRARVRQVVRTAGDDEPRAVARPSGPSRGGATMLAEIYNWFTEGFDTADLKDAKALLDELAA